MGPRRKHMADNTELTAALAARAYGYGYPGAGPAGALAPHRHAYYGMQEHIKAEERMLEQRRTLYSDLRSAEAKEPPQSRSVSPTSRTPRLASLRSTTRLAVQLRRRQSLLAQLRSTA